MVRERIVAVIGTGVMGSAVALELSKKDNFTVIGLERNLHSVRGENQSSRNSGVIHAGIYYDPELMPIKAEFCVRGNKELYAFGERHGVPVKRVGKYVVAKKEEEIPYLEEILKIARRNGVPNVELVTRDQMREYEPNIDGIAALSVPSSGIVEPTSLVAVMQRLAEGNGAYFVGRQELIGIELQPDGTYTLHVNNRRETEISEGIHAVVNCAGLYAGDIARMINPESHYEIIPMRGESAQFSTRADPRLLVTRNIYPAPFGFWLADAPDYGAEKGDPARVDIETYKKLLTEGRIERTVGVHLTPTFGEGNNVSDIVSIGPAKNPGYRREDLRTGLKEPAVYHAEAVRLLPSLRRTHVTLYQAGNMAKLLGSCDWVTEPDCHNETFWNVLGFDSPGLTAALPYGAHVAQKVIRSLQQ
jgi:glycine/D-amino acid oxidase-like deaminating enzyme